MVAAGAGVVAAATTRATAGADKRARSLGSSSSSKHFSAQRQKVFGEASFMGFYGYLFESFVIMNKIIGGKAQC